MSIEAETSKKEAPKEDRLSTLVPVVTALVLIITAAISLLSARIPLELFYIISVVLLLSTLALFVAVLYKPISAYVNSQITRRKHKLITARNLKDLKAFINDFIELTHPERGNTISYTLEGLVHRSGIPEFQRITLPSPYNFHSLAQSLQRALGQHPINKDRFLSLLELFSGVLRIYNEYAVCKPLEEIRKAGANKVGTETKECYRDIRSSYIRFLENYGKYVKTLNQQFGYEAVRVPYYELPKEL